MIIDNLQEANELYQKKLTLIFDLSKQVITRGKSGMCAGAQTINDCEILSQGYLRRFENLSLKLEELTNDYKKLFSFEKSFWYKVLGFLPFFKANRNSIQEFVNKWKIYEPGW
jgi:hypothetical protein